MDWNDVVPNTELRYHGQPPFIGARLMEKRQRHGIRLWRLSGLKSGFRNSLVPKTTEYIKDTSIECAFVHNSITQGEQVAICGAHCLSKASG